LPFDDNYQKKMAYQGAIDGLTGSFDFTAATAQSFAATYNDIGSNGTPITTNFTGATMTTDADNSSVQNIGFNFMFNGTLYSNFILNTNGYIKFGVNIPSPGLFYSTATSTTGGTIPASDIDMLYPYNHDLMGTATTEYRVATLGTAGSRVCTIQFKNVADKLAPIQYTNMNFQIKLFEEGNRIEFVYGTWTASANAPSATTAAVGIKGVYDSSVNLTKGASTPWSSALSQANNMYFVNGNYISPVTPFNTMNSVLPNAGRTFRFTPNQTILPLNLLQFSAVQKGSAIDIGWLTTNEINTKSFEVQRSVNGVDFLSIGTVASRGNGSASANNYHFTDEDIPGAYATLYYRLLQHDKDGRSTFSNVITIRRNNTETFTVNVVNPFYGRIDMSLQSAAAGKVSISVMNLNGVVLIQKQLSIAGGSSLISLHEGSTLSKGIYIVKVIKDHEEKVVRITKL
jgi:hypothetical protein